MRPFLAVPFPLLLVLSISRCSSSAPSGPAGSSTPSGATGASSGAAGSASGGDSSAAQACVDAINADRATLGLPAYARWTKEESCVGGQAESDSAANTAHGAFTKCGEMAQDECPGWPGPAGQMIGDCLKAMWAEGPGGGHYDNMTSTGYTMVACGFYTLADGSVWATQDFR